jgi:hypothetical protein
LSFENLTDQDLSTEVELVSPTLTGFDLGTATISGTGSPKISCDSGTNWGAECEVSENGILKIKLTTAENYNEEFSGTINVGGVETGWSVGTKLGISGTFNNDNTYYVSTTTLTNGKALIAYKETYINFKTIDSNANLSDETDFSAGDASGISVTQLPKEEALVAYKESSSSIKMFKINKDITRTWGPETLDNINYQYGIGAVSTTFPNGNVLVAYSVGNDDKFRILHNDNTLSEIYSLNNGGTQNHSVTTLSNGNALIAYQKDGSTPQNGAFILVSNTGAKLTSEKLFTEENEESFHVSVSPFPNGDALIAYRTDNDKGKYAIVSSGGTVIRRDEFNTNISSVKVDNKIVQHISTTTLQDGNILIAFADSEGGKFQIRDNDGNEILPNQIFNNGPTHYISATTFNNGDVLIAYTDSSNKGDYFIYKPSIDPTPDPFELPPVTDAEPNSTVTITGSITGTPTPLSGIQTGIATITTNNPEADAQISCNNGQDYSYFCQASSGSQIVIQVTTPEQYNTTYTGTVTIGTTEAEWSVSTTIGKQVTFPEEVIGSHYSLSMTTFSNGNTLIAYTDTLNTYSDISDDTSKFFIIDSTGSIVTPVSDTLNTDWTVNSTTLLSNDNVLITSRDKFMIVSNTGSIVQEKTEISSIGKTHWSSAQGLNNKTLVAYREFGTDLGKFIMIDNNLNEITSPITFSSNSTYFSKVTTFSNGNSLIIYQDVDDSARGKIAIISNTGAILTSGGVFNSVASSIVSNLTILSATSFLDNKALITYISHEDNISKFRIVSSTGVLTEPVALNTTLDTSRYVTTATLHDGNILIAYSAAGYKGKFIIVDSSGNIIQSEKDILSNDAVAPLSSTTLPNGDVIISYLYNDFEGGPATNRFIIIPGSVVQTPDPTPDDFELPPVTNAEPNTEVIITSSAVGTTNPIELSNFDSAIATITSDNQNADAQISCDGGTSYGYFCQATPNNQIKVRLNASNFGEVYSGTVRIGEFSTGWSVTVLSPVTIISGEPYNMPECEQTEWTDYCSGPGTFARTYDGDTATGWYPAEFDANGEYTLERKTNGQSKISYIIYGDNKSVHNNGICAIKIFVSPDSGVTWQEIFNGATPSSGTTRGEFNELITLQEFNKIRITAGRNTGLLEGYEPKLISEGGQECGWMSFGEIKVEN